MAGPRVFDGNERIRALTTKPADPNAVTVTEAEAAEKIECRILKADYRLSPTASDTVGDALLCNEGNAVSYGASNYEGTITPVRFLDEDGKPVTDEDVAWDLFKSKGTRLWILESIGKHHTEPFEAGDEYDLYEVITDNPQRPSDRSGWIKRVVPLGVQNAWINKTIAAGTGG